MKTLHIKIIYLLFVSFTIAFYSCKKENVKNDSTNYDTVSSINSPDFDHDSKGCIKEGKIGAKCIKQPGDCSKFKACAKVHPVNYDPNSGALPTLGEIDEMATAHVDSMIAWNYYNTNNYQLKYQKTYQFIYEFYYP